MSAHAQEGDRHEGRLVDVVHAVMVDAVSLTACTHARLAARVALTETDQATTRGGAA